ncbi:MAG: DNA repair protein RadC [Anaerosomatales bacterium]|nr:DNA repair protein RadC [Anaerosomatales bacterium]MDT8433558.1 DNA repair protein RadC [Anaerosomatales bacterium]
MAPRLMQNGATPREIVLSGRVESLSDAALLSVLIGEEGDDRARVLLERHPAPDALWRVCAEDLVVLPGVGPAAASRVLACLEMSRRAAVWRTGSKKTVSTPEDVVALCWPQMRGADKEHFWALALNTKNHVMRVVEVSVGSLNASIVHPRELFKEAVRLSAASVVVVHNHPSGDPTPSGADIQLTRRLVKAGDVLGIELLDHVIIGDGGEHSSLRELNLM